MSLQTYGSPADDLNRALAEAAPSLWSTLSQLGRRLYFPQGLLTQGAEAKARARHINATIGIATEAGRTMHLPSFRKLLGSIAPEDAFNYAPPGGRPALRERWRQKLVAENPSLRGKQLGLPIVTSGITHGLALAGDLFLDPGDVVVLPDQLWGNYRLAYEVRLGARLATFPMFLGQRFHVEALRERLERDAREQEKLVVLLNFPNNPTGYTPSERVARDIVGALHGVAARGTRVVVLCDDAYFGLFFHHPEPSLSESLFALLTNLHPNLLAVKLDGATKELFAWGLRCGFLTFGLGPVPDAPRALAALDAKVRGDIRAVVSNCSQLAQTLVEQALADPELEAERSQKGAVLKQRAAEIARVAGAAKYASSWDVYPFNSGYFMQLKLRGVSAHALRLHLLERYAIGLISTSDSDLRIAISCLETEQVAELFETIHRAAEELRAT